VSRCARTLPKVDYFLLPRIRLPQADAQPPGGWPPPLWRGHNEHWSDRADNGIRFHGGRVFSLLRHHPRQLPGRGAATRDNHESARWMELGSKRCRGPVRFGRLSAGSGTLGADYGSSAATGIGARDAREGFGFWLFIHAGLKHELARRFLAALRNPLGLTTHSRLRPQVCRSVVGAERSH
jgi:hypothetical protein